MSDPITSKVLIFFTLLFLMKKEEYKNYFNHSFKHQNIYEVPKTEVFEL